MTPHEFQKVLERQQHEPQPTVHEWLQQWLFFFAGFIRPHLDRNGNTDCLLNLGSGWGAYRLKDDLPDDCRRAIAGMAKVRDLQACIGDDDSFVSGMRLVVQGAYDLGRIAAKFNNTPTLTTSTNDARDEWMRTEKLAGKTHSQIRFALVKEHPEWDSLDSEQAVGAAIKRHCERKGIPVPNRKRK
jgi:hypothetical protein